MCRALAYMGPPLRLSALLHQPDSALVRQAVDPRYLQMLNLAGFGMASWNHRDADPDVPLLYRSTTVPVYDDNLVSLAGKLATTNLLAHVRGVAWSAGGKGFGPQNLHPFRYPGVRLAFCHNGDLAGFARMKAAMQDRIKPAIRAHITGSTDSEHVYALLLSQLDDPGGHHSAAELLNATGATLRVIRRLRRDAGIDTSSSMNLFLSDGRQLLALRFTFDYGRYPLDPTRLHDANTRFLSLWTTVGSTFEADASGRWLMRGGTRRHAAILASEPLTRDPTGWVEVPEYSAVTVTAWGPGEPVEVGTTEIDA